MILKRVCLFLCASLFIVDLLFLSLYLEAKNTTNTLSDTMIEKTVSYYEGIGVKINKNVIRKKIPSHVIYTFVNNNYSLGNSVAQRIAENLISKNALTSFIETPDGQSFSFSLKDNIVASFRTYIDSFSFEYIYGDFSNLQDKLPAQEYYTDSKKLDSKKEKLIDVFVKSISKSDKFKYTLCGIYDNGEVCVVSIKQATNNSCEIKDTYANIIIKDNKIVYANGAWIFAKLSDNYSEHLIDGVNALNRVDAHVSEFISEDVEYMYRYSENELYYLIPVWKIEYIDNEGRTNIQYIDAVKK